MSTSAALPAIRYFAFERPNAEATLASFQFTQATLYALHPPHSFFDVTNADLSGFEKAGGKLILWHGLADPHIRLQTPCRYTRR